MLVLRLYCIPFYHISAEDRGTLSTVREYRDKDNKTCLHAAVTSGNLQVFAHFLFNISLSYHVIEFSKLFMASGTVCLSYNSNK